MRAAVERRVEEHVRAEVLLVDEPAREASARLAGTQGEVLGAPPDGDRTGGGLLEPPFQRDAKAGEAAGAVAFARHHVDLRAAHEFGDPQILRVLVDVVRRSELEDVAVEHDRHPVRHRQRLGLVVGDVDERRAEVSVELGELRAHVDAKSGVEVRQRLVHQECGGVAHHRPPQGDPLALAAGELPGLAFQQMLDLEGPGRVPDRCAQGLELPATAGNKDAQQGEALPESQVPQQKRRRQVLADGQVRVQRIGLEDHGQIAAAGPHVVDHGTVDLHVALGLRLQPRDNPQGRRLPAAGGTDQGQELTVGDIEIDTVEDPRVAEGLGDSLESDTRQGLPLLRV